MKYSLHLALLAASLTAALWVESASGASLRLKDGSVVEGKVSGLKNGVYTVRSRSLGTIEVKEADVASISYDQRSAGSNSSSGTANSAAQQELQQIQRGLAGDSVTMSMISELQNDPQLQGILDDPEIMRAVSSGDLAALMANEKFMALMNNADIKAITRQVTGKQ